MAFSIGSFVATLGMNSSEYTSGILSAQSANAAFGQSITNFIANPLTGAIALLKQAGSAFYSAAQSTADYAEQVALGAQKANVAVTTFQALKEELKRSGENAEGFSDQLRAFGNTLDAAKTQGGAAAKAFERIGLDPAKITQSDVGIRQVLEALARVPVEAGRGALAQDLFGRSGAALANAVAASGGSVQALIDKYTNFGLVLDEQAIKKLLKLDTNLDTVNQSFEGVKRTLQADFFGSINEAFGQFDANGEGVKKFLQEVKPLVQEVGTALGSASSSLKEIAGFLEAIRPFTDLLRIIVGGASAGVGAIGEGGGNLGDFKAALGERLGVAGAGLARSASERALRDARSNPHR